MCAGAMAVTSATCGRTMPRQRGDLAGIVHAHFEHRKFGVARHPGEAQRHAGMVVVALDRAVDRPAAAAVERRVQRFLGAGLADRAGDSDDPCRRSARAPRRPEPSSASATSSTSTCGPSTGCDTSAPAAPAAKAPATNLCPSWTVPGMATNRSPGPTSRLSKVTPVTSNGALAVPPVAAAISALGPQRAHAAHSRATSASSNGSTWSPMIWPVSWPLPASRMMSPAPGHADAPRRWLRGGRRSRSRRATPGMHLGADRRRVLAARIVVGDDDHVGQPRRDRAHRPALALVAVAAGAEDGDQPALDVRPQRRDRRFQRVGACGHNRHRPARRRG